jgi:hypothetical protein
MYPPTAKIAPRMLTEAVVSIPAKTKVMPKARAIGHVVGAGIFMLNGGSSRSVLTGTSVLIF